MSRVPSPGRVGRWDEWRVAIAAKSINALALANICWSCSVAKWQLLFRVLDGSKWYVVSGRTRKPKAGFQKCTGTDVFGPCESKKMNWHRRSVNFEQLIWFAISIERQSSQSSDQGKSAAGVYFSNQQCICKEQTQQIPANLSQAASLTHQRISSIPKPICRWLRLLNLVKSCFLHILHLPVACGHLLRFGGWCGEVSDTEAPLHLLVPQMTRFQSNCPHYMPSLQYLCNELIWITYDTCLFSWLTLRSE